MPQEIQLSLTSGRDDIHQQNSEMQRQSSDSDTKRVHQPLLLYIAVMSCEVITIFISLLLLLVPVQNKKYVYLTYIILTPIRCCIFLGNSLRLIGCCKKLVQLYILLDNIFLVQLASIITYVFLNFKSQVEYAKVAIVCYPILLFFLVGNFRVMLVFCRWSRAQVIVYKLIKVIGSTYFLVYGGYLIIYNDSSTSSDLFMLWVFTTCGFWAEMCFSINSFDSSDGMSTRYKLQQS